MESDVPENERKLLKVIVWSSTLAAAGCLALMFGFNNSGGQFRYEFTFSSVIAFLVGLLVMVYFWRKIFSMQHAPKKMWRFILMFSVLTVVLFIGFIFLPRFRPLGGNNSDLLQGLILGFLAVAAVFIVARMIMRLLEKADENSEKNAHSNEH
jgi:uncharacterized membrane protein (DUF485 family)